MPTTQLSYSSAPQPNLVMTPQERRQAGIGRNYVDQYNQMQMAQYNNEYNMWAKQQEQQYNSPAAQVERLRSAGLNPNFNSIEGAGNVTLPQSSGSVTPSVGSNQAKNVSNLINSFDIFKGVIDSFRGAVSAYSDLTQTVPLRDLQDFRKTFLQIQQNRASSSFFDNFLKRIESSYQAWYKGGVDTGHGVELFNPYSVDGDGGIIFDFLNPSGSQAGKTAISQKTSVDLINAIRRYQNQELQPQQKEKVAAEIERLTQSAGLTQEQKELYNLMAGTKVGSAVAGVLMPFLLKLIL